MTFIMVYQETCFGQNSQGNWESCVKRKEKKLRKCSTKEEAVKEFRKEIKDMQDYLLGFGPKVNRRYDLFQLFREDKRGKRRRMK